MQCPTLLSTVLHRGFRDLPLTVLLSVGLVVETVVVTVVVSAAAVVVLVDVDMVEEVEVVS